MFGKRGMRRLKAGFCLLVCVVLFLSTGAISADKEEADIEATRTALEKWVETQRIISQEKRDLELAKEMLSERIELVQREIDSLKEKIKDANESIAEADKKRAEMMEENEKLKTASESLKGVLVSLESDTKQLLKQMPKPIQEKVKLLSQQLPDEQAETETKLTISQRFQNVVGILNEINKSNRNISVTSEVRSLPDGTSAEVTTLYIGVGKAYYVGANNSIAGIGTASDDGWEWEPANEAAPQVAQAVAILNNEQVAAFIQLPIEIK